jgi:hypothetical protein
MNMSPPSLSVCLFDCVDKFTCPDDKSSIDSRFVCDGEEDCLDGADERNCHYYTCKTGGLIDATRKCDNWRDCKDGSDETDCPVRCSADDTMTLPASARCNETNDCADGSDETDCP